MAQRVGKEPVFSQTNLCLGDAQLVTMTKADRIGGDRETQWRLWLEGHGDRLLLYARQLTPSREDAEDLLQETISRLWRESTQHEPETGWVVTMMRRRAIDRGRQRERRQARESRYQQTYEIGRGDYFEPDFDSRERGELVQQALEVLPRAQREVVVLKVWGELTFAEIAQALELSANTVASRYRYGLGALREKLKAINA